MLDEQSCQYTTHMDNSFGIWLSRQLKQREMTQSDLAAKMETRPSTVGNWVHGRRRPDHESCRKIAEALYLPQAMVEEAAGWDSAELIDYDTEEEGVLLAGWRRLTPENRDVVAKMVRFLLREGDAYDNIGGDN